MKQHRIPKLFFSHSSKDKALLRELVEAARIGLNLNKGDIRCSSIDGYGFISGEDIVAGVRNEGRGSNSLIAVITPDSLKSSWVLFELGARWGADKHLAIVVANGATFQDIPEAINRVFARKCTEDDLVALFVDIADELNPGGTGSFDVVAARRHLRTAEQYCQATAQRSLDRKWEHTTVLNTFEASAKADFLRPHSETIVSPEIEYEIDLITSPIEGRSLWLCIEYSGNLWPKTKLKSARVIKDLVREYGSPPAGAFSLSIIEVDSKGNQDFESWIETGDKTGRYPAFRQIEGIRIAEVDLILDKTI